MAPSKGLPMQVKQVELRRSRGINMIEVVVATIILTAVSLAVLGAMNASFHIGADSEPKGVAQTGVANVQTDLNAIVMYDNSALSHFSPGTSLTAPTPQPAPTGASYVPSDMQPVTVTISAATSAPNNTTEKQLSINYSIAGATTGSAALSGSSAITVGQRAPKSCDSRLSGKGITAPDGTAC